MVPEFYTRDNQGIPIAWVARMRESMARLTPRFAASRTVREYTEQHYLPAASAYRARAANKGTTARNMVDWHHEIERKWSAVRFGDLNIATRDGQHIFAVQVLFNDLDPGTVLVELYANGLNGAAPVRLEMTRLHPLAGTAGGFVYSATVPAARPPGDYTARLMPHCDGVAIPLEDARIIWQR